VNGDKCEYFNGFINAYCDNGNCTARDFDIRIKTYGADDPVTVHCPLCGHIAIGDSNISNDAETLNEHRTRIDQKSRVNVNIQQYLKNSGSLTIPASILLDDSLPD
jgi:hypothetical protein